MKTLANILKLKSPYFSKRQITRIIRKIKKSNISFRYKLFVILDSEDNPISDQSVITLSKLLKRAPIKEKEKKLLNRMLQDPACVRIMQEEFGQPVSIKQKSEYFDTHEYLELMNRPMCKIR